jgi:hypothetical protein
MASLELPKRRSISGAFGAHAMICLRALIAIPTINRREGSPGK